MELNNSKGYLELVKTATLLAITIFSINSWAGPNTIDVTGLIPGETPQAEVERIEARPGFIIGGYSLICVPKYLDGVLSRLLCVTGKDNYSKDTTEAEERFASNTEVHSALLKGFTKKFGPPSKTENTSVKNRFGAEFDSSSAIWIDKKGNMLTISKIASKVDEGLLLLESAQQLREDQTNKAKTDNQRRF